MDSSDEVGTCAAWVKLVHARDLERFDRFPRYQEVEGVSLADYRRGVRELAARRSRVPHLASLADRLDELESEVLEQYGAEEVLVPPALAAREVRVPLTGAILPDTRSCSTMGRICDRTLVVTPGLTREVVFVTHCGPRSVVSARELAELRSSIASLAPAERAELGAIRESLFRHPVVFVSHRWITAEHPDPTGAQLALLRQLRDCFLIYDYCSFPQLPRTADEEAGFRTILGGMDALLERVIVLRHPEYLQRGWCVYEYAVASLKGSIVCDEVGEDRFVALRDWVSTRAPLPTNLFRDSGESMQENHIHEQILRTVNEILPLFRASRFRGPEDSEIVGDLLRESLRRALPRKRTHVTYLGEWAYEDWTDEELAAAFKTELRWPRTQSLEIQRHRTNVATSPAEASRDRYRTGAVLFEEQVRLLGMKLGVTPPPRPEPCARPRCHATVQSPDRSLRGLVFRAVGGAFHRLVTTILR